MRSNDEDEGNVGVQIKYYIQKPEFRNMCHMEQLQNPFICQFIQYVRSHCFCLTLFYFLGVLVFN